LTTTAETQPDSPVDRARLALLQRVQRKYLTVTEAVSIGPFAFVFQRVANPDEMLERLELAQQAGRPVPQWQPYWAENWAASWGLAQVLVGQDLAGRQVLDLGCGLGLTGAIAAAKGATVWMVDAAHPALLFSRLNTWPWRERVHVRRLDWRVDQLAFRFPLIVGSDIIYDREDWPYLELFWRQHLAEGGCALLGESGRSTGAEFPGWLEGRGWTVHRSQQAVPQAPKPIRIFEAAPCGAVERAER
jgi:predicted nicotinamide N-methyase